MFHRAMVLPFLLASSVSAQTTTWIGPSDGDWFDEANWSLGIPDSTTRAVFDVNGSLDLLIDLTPAFAQGLTVTGGVVDIRTIDAMGDLRLDTSLDGMPTIEVAGAGTNAIVRGDLALGSIEVRDGGSLTMEGRTSGLRIIRLRSEHNSLTTLTLEHLHEFAPTPSHKVLVDGEGNSEIRMISLDTSALRIDIDDRGAESARLNALIDQSVVGSLFFTGASEDEATRTLVLRNSTIRERAQIFRASITMENTVNIGRGIPFEDQSQIEQSDIALGLDANLVLENASNLQWNALDLARGASLVARTRGAGTSIPPIAIFTEMNLGLGAHAFFGPSSERGEIVFDRQSVGGPGWIILVTDPDFASDGMAMSGARIEIFGALVVHTPIHELNGLIVQHAGLHPSLNRSMSVLALAGIEDSWGQTQPARLVGGGIRARDFVLLRSLDVTLSNAQAEIDTVNMWIGDGTLRLLESNPVESRSQVRVVADHLVVGDWQIVGSQSIPAVSESPDGRIVGVGELVGSVHNAGVLEPGAPIGAIEVIGSYSQAVQQSPRPPRPSQFYSTSPNGAARIGPGSLIIDLVAPDLPSGHDVLYVSGLASIGGTLQLRFPSSEPADGDYEIVSATHIEGEFKIVEAPPLSGGRTAQIRYTPTSVLVRIGVPGDVNGDGVVNGRDIAAWVALAKEDSPDADVNGDGVIDGTDLAAILAGWPRG